MTVPFASFRLIQFFCSISNSVDVPGVDTRAESDSVVGLSSYSDEWSDILVGILSLPCKLDGLKINSNSEIAFP
jgi:hypothetical protein